MGNSSVSGKRRQDWQNRQTGHFVARNVVDCANFFHDSLAGSMQKSAMDISNDEWREVTVVMQNYRSLDGLAHLASENTSAYSN